MPRRNWPRCCDGLMPNFPEPPRTRSLAKIPPLKKALPAGTLLWRIIFQSGEHADTWNAFRHFGPADGRFDHHLPPPRVQNRGILYAAIQGPTCFAEFFQETRVIDRVRRSPALVGFPLRRAVPLLDLTGAWPTRAGASMAIHSGPRARARRWSQAIYEAYPRIEGLFYCSSMDASRGAVALC